MSSEIRITRFVSAFNICKAIKAPAGLVLKMPVNPYSRLFSSEINGMLSKPFAAGLFLFQQDMNKGGLFHGKYYVNPAYRG